MLRGVKRTMAKQAVSIQPNSGQKAHEKLPRELRMMIYAELFEPLPDTIEFGAVIPAVPAILQAIPYYRRADLNMVYLTKRQLTVVITDGSDSATYARWAKAGICERLAHVRKLHLIWHVIYSARLLIEVTIHFKTGDEPARIEWFNLPVYESQERRLEAAVHRMKSTTPDSEDLEQILRPYESSWVFSWPTESEDEGDDPTMGYYDTDSEEEEEEVTNATA